MTVNLPGFRAQFPELPDSVAADPVVERALVEAKLIHGYRELATYYVAAHLVRTDPQLAKGVSPAGAVTADGAGPLKVTYQRPTKERTAYEQFFMRTEYGRRFLMLDGQRFTRMRLWPITGRDRGPVG